MLSSTQVKNQSFPSLQSPPLPLPISFLRQPSTTHQQLNLTPANSPLLFMIQAHHSQLRTVPTSHQDTSQPRPHRKAAERALELKDCTHSLVLFNFNSGLDFLTVRTGMAMSILQNCFTNQMSVYPVSHSFSAPLQPAWSLSFHPATPPKEAIPILCPPTPLPHRDPVKDHH